MNASTQTTTLCADLQFWQAVHHCVQRRVLTIARREDRIAYRPANAELGIVPRDADLAGGIIKIRALVLDLRDRRDDAKSVGEAMRHVALLEVGRREVHAHPS